MATDTKIILKRSDVQTAAPNSAYLEFGELAFNYRDEKLYYRGYDGSAEVIKNYDFQRIIPVEKGGTGASTAAGARLGIGAAPLHDPSFTGVASLASNATLPTISLGTDATSGRRLATVAYVRAEIADDAPTKTGGGASGDNWNIGILKNAATATKFKTGQKISNATSGSDIIFDYTFDGSTAITPALTINSDRKNDIQTALSLVPGTDIQAYDADLWAIAELTGTSGLLRKTAADTWSLDTTTYTPTARTLTITTGNGIEGGLSAQSLADNRAWTLGLTTTGVAAGTYNNNSTTTNSFTVDDRGRITSVGAAVTIKPHFDNVTDKPTTLLGYGITDALDVSATAQTKTGSLTASSFIKSDGTSSQFLKADGSSDSTSYTPTSRTLTIANGTGITGGSNTAQTLADNRAWTLGLTGQALRVHNLTTNGFFVRASDASVVARSIAVGTGLSITNADGISANPTISLATGNLTSLRDITTGGFLTRTASGTLTPRSIAVSGTGLSITNANGVDNNPTIVSNATSSNDASTLVARDASGAFSAGVITGSSFIISGTANTTLSGSATVARTLTLPNKSGTIAITDDIPSHTYTTTPATTVAASAGVVLSAITVNELGHTTSVSSKTLTAADIPDLDASKITSGSLNAALFTDESSTGAKLTGFVAGTSVSTVAASDTILQAFQKLVPNIAAKANTASPTFTGTVTLPTGSNTTAPLRFLTGSNTATLTPGNVEFDGTNLYITQTGPIRKTLAYIDSTVSNATSATSAEKLTTARTISTGTASDISFSYTFDGSANITPNLTINTSRASNIRTALGLAKGIDGGVQEYNADLAAIAALSDGPDTDTFIDTGYLRKTGAGSWYIDQETSPPSIAEKTTITGDVIGSSAIGSRDITNSVLATISGLTAGIYNGGSGTSATISSITPFEIDAKGRVISTKASVTIAPAWGSITGKPTTLSGYGITDGQTANSNLTSISTLSTAGTNGLLRRNANDTWSFDTTAYTPQSRTLTIAGATNSGITVTPSTATNLSANASWSISLAAGNLTQLRDLSTSGIVVHNAATGGGMSTRSIAVGTGLSITNANGVNDNPTISLATGNLTSLRDITTGGFLTRTASSTLTPRSITVASGSTGLSITNGDGVSGNPTLTLSSSSTNSNNSLVARDGSGNFSAGTITATLSGNASSASAVAITATDTANTSHGIVFVSGTTNSETLRTDSGGLSYNPSTNTLTAGTYSGGAALSGTPTAPTATTGTNTTQIATTAYVRGEISALVNSAPAALDTLKEISDYISTDNATGAIATALGAKAPLASPLFTGNVGIGMSTTPAAKLEILGTTPNDSSPELRISGSLGYIDFHNSAAVGNYNPIVSAGDKTIIFSDGTTGTGNLVIAPWSGTASGIKITAAGNVGIGTSSPVTPLDIASAGIRVNTGRAISGNANDGGISLHGGTNGNGANIELYGGSHTGSPNMAYFDADTMYFRGVAGTSEYMRIASTGNVGIGTNSPGTKLDVASNDVIARFSGSGSEWQGVVIRPTDSSGTVGRGGFVDFQNESLIALTSIHSYHNTDGSSDIRLLNTPSGVRTSDRRAERIRITGAGKTLIGGTSALGTRFGTNNITPNIQLLSNATGGTNLNDSSSMLFGRFSNDADSSKLFFAKTRGTPASPTSATAVVNSGDHLGWLSFGGYDSSNIVEAARVEATVDTGTVVNATAIVPGKRYKIAVLGNTTWSTFGVSGAAAVGTVFTATANGSETSGTGVVWEEPATGSVPGALTFSTTSLSSTAPTERMRINRSGNVGIGTKDPTVRLDIQNGTSEAQIRIGPSTATGYIFGSANHLGFYSASGGQLYVNRSFPLVDIIGTAVTSSNAAGGNTPLIVRNDNAENNTTKTAGLLFQGVDTASTIKSTAMIQCGPAESNYIGSYLAFQTRSADALSERMRIDSSGNVGIGTGSSAPAARLEVKGGTSNDANPEFRITGSSGHIEFHNSLTAGSYNSITSAGDKAIIFSDGTIDTGNLVIAPWATGTKGIRITKDGNVGIGTNPGARLDVVGPTLTPATQSTYAMWIGNTGGGSGDLAFASNSTNAFIQSWGGKPLIINGQGNSVGIGKAPTSALDVNGTITATTFSGSGASLTSIPNSATTATNANTAGAIVARDSSGNFTAGTITATLSGTATGNIKQGGGTSQTSNTVYMGWSSASKLRVQVDTTDFGSTWPIDVSGNAASVTGGVYTSGDQTIAGNKSFSNNILVGTTVRRAVGDPFSPDQTIYNEGTGLGHYKTLVGVANRTDSAGATIVLGKSRGTAVGSSTRLAINDQLGEIRFAGADGTDLHCVGAAITAGVDLVPDTNSMPGRLVFSTTKSGAETPTERMRISSQGGVTIGTTQNSGGLYINGGVSSSAYLTVDGQIQHFMSGANRILHNDSLTSNQPGQILDIPLIDISSGVFSQFATDVFEIIITVGMQRQDITTSNINDSTFYFGAYKDTIVIAKSVNAQGFTSYQVNRASSVNISTGFGAALPTLPTGSTPTNGWASAIATAATAEADGTVYLRLRGHNVADSATYWYYSTVACYVQAYSI